MTPLILALDVSKTNTGIAEGRIGEKPIAYSLHGADMDVTRAAAKLGEWLIHKINADRPDFVFIEAALDPGASRPKIDWEKQEWHSTRDPNTTITLAKMVGVVEFITHMKSVQFRTANVHSVRAVFIGERKRIKGPEAKRRVKAMCHLLGWAPKNRDESDALAVWFFGCVTVKPHLAPVITPGMWAKCAATIGGSDIGSPDAWLRK